jgi:ribonucleoside-diphosphate reductase alpha chain
MEKILLDDINFEELEVLEIEDSKNETMDIEVEETHYYTLANGIVSHNTVSTQTQTSSGVEPAFMVYYTRRRKINPQEENVRVDFVDEVGDQWTEYNVFHHKFIDWFHANRVDLMDNPLTNYKESKEYLEMLPSEEVNKLIEKSPYYKAMANDVDWVEKVRMQGAIQKWVDHSISVTVNLPNQVDEQLVNDVYVTGWESGCKGITIYRDGSRSGVLISKEEKTSEEKVEEYFKDNNAPRRPKRLECDVVHFSNKGEKWIAFVGLLEGRPYEIFTGNSENFDIPNNIEKGEIVREKVDGESFYNFCYETKEGEPVCGNNLKTSFNPQFTDISKMVSALMRHGMPIFYIIEVLGSLHLDGEFITTWKSGVKRILKRYLKEEDNGKEVTGKTCDNCGSTNIMIIEGCETCAECASSKCS